MEKCLLCGQCFEDEARCPICGFEIPRHLYNDIRDSKEHDLLKSEEGSRASLDRRSKITLSYIENIDVHSSPSEQIDSMITEALELLSIPTYVPIGQDLCLTDPEKELIKAIGRKMDELDEVNSTVSGSPETYIRLSNGEYAIGMRPSAISHLDKAILKDPRSVDALYNKARILFYKHDYPKSIILLDKILKLEPGSRRILYFRELVDQMCSKEKE